MLTKSDEGSRCKTPDSSGLTVQEYHHQAAEPRARFQPFDYEEADPSEETESSPNQ